MSTGRPSVLDDSRMVCFYAGENHRNYIAAIIARLKRETGEKTIPRAEALRFIIEDHQRLTTPSDPSP